jgi:hypothetical protein
MEYKGLTKHLLSGTMQAGQYWAGVKGAVNHLALSLPGVALIIG